MTIQRFAAVTTGLALVGSSIATFAASSDNDHDGPRREHVFGGAFATAGLAAMGGGTGIARWAERALRPGVAQAGRGSAAIGAALVAGSISGLVVATAVDGRIDRRATHAARKQVDDATARVNDSTQQGKDRVDAANARVKHTRELVEETEPAAVELQIDDGRVDLVGAPVGAAATAIMGQYGTDHMFWIGQQQRTEDGRTFSIGSVYSEAARARLKDEPDVEIKVDRDQVAEVITSRIDRSPSGRSGIIDVDEATSWYAPGGIGEHDITWTWEEHLASIREIANSTVPASDTHPDTTWRIEPFLTDPDTPLLALVGVDSLNEAIRLAHHASDYTARATAIVELPEDAPTRYAFAALSYNDDRLEGVWDELKVFPHIHSSVAAIVDDDAVMRRRS